MRHRYVAEQTLVSASLLSFLYVHVAAGEYCMAFPRQQKMRDAAASAALPLHLRPRIRQSCARLRVGGTRGTSSDRTSVVKGKSVAVRVYIGVRRISKKKTQTKIN